MAVALPSVSVFALSTPEPGSSRPATVASKSSIFRSKEVSCVSIADAVLSPLAPCDSRVSQTKIAMQIVAGCHVMMITVAIAEDDHFKGLIE